jgi:pyridinium-3,5-biscarboxylic acid mononucleotide synthase
MIDRAALAELLAAVAAGQRTPAAAAEALAGEIDLGWARLDADREERTGAPEVVFGGGKTVEQIAGIFRAFAERGRPCFATRVAPEAAFLGDYDPTARTLRADPPGWSPAPRAGRVVVCTGGTSDLPVAAEAMSTLRWLGFTPHLVADVGVAGVHRLLARAEVLRAAEVVIAVAGMEGALPSVVAGLVRAPVVAVPTSVGYGSALGGWTALSAMLTSCAAGVVVVNIDNGFGAALAASRILP